MRPNHSCARLIIGLLTVVVCGAAAFAQTPAHQDFSGYWELRLDGMSVPPAVLTRAATAASAAQARKDAEALSRCVAVGMPAVMNDRNTLDIRQSPTVVGIVAKTQSSTRYIYTDGRQHPEKDELEATTNGHSVGRWEGDTLVVDTVGFNDRGLTRVPGGGYRTAASHLTERMRLLANGQLSVNFEWDDPAVFVRPHTYEFRYVKVASIAEPRVQECFANDQERTAFLLRQFTSTP
jgi:hypothetical protein